MAHLHSVWETAKEILSGKPKGGKLIVLGVFLVSVGVGLSFYSQSNFALPFVLLGALAFGSGLALYQREADRKLRKKH